MLVGREQELATLAEACRAAAAGHGSTVVVNGEPGIGKTALLTAAGAADDGSRFLRATGVEAERTVAFATLQGLLWPLRDDLDELEAVQAGFLRGVLDLGPGTGATTFAVGAATLALLSIASRDRPLVVIVDDAHWADLASQEVLSFVGRRLDHEHVALLAAVRDGEPCLLADERSFARLELRGLDDSAARVLLERASSMELAPQVAERLTEVCAGNALGLKELPLVLTEAQRRGEEPLPTALEAGPLVQRAFAARASHLSPDARHSLLLLAAAGEAVPAVLARAGVTPLALDEIEQTGLVARRRGAIEFEHPLMQSAVYGAASPGDRRDAHRAIAAVVDGGRRAWHLAEAADGPDESVAEALEAAAADARLAGGLAAEAQALERAAELTPDDEPRAKRLLGAARAWRRAGRVEHADAIVEQALPFAATVRTRAEIQLERGGALVRDYKSDASLGLLLAEADRAAPTEPKLAAQLLVKAAIAAHIRADPPTAIELAERACALAGRDGDRPELEAVNALVEVKTAAGVPADEQDLALVARAAALLEQPELRAGSEEVHWIAYCCALHERDGQARSLSDSALAETRAGGDIWNLCYALYARAAIEQTAGRIDVARTYASEGVALADQIGETWRIYEAYGLLAEVEAGRGNLEGCRQALDAKFEYWHDDPSREFYRVVAPGFACLACGRPEEAISYLETAVPFLDAGPSRAWYLLIPLELAEAYVGVGRKREAETLIRQAAPGIEACALIRPKVKLARVRGLVAPESKLDSAFAAVLVLLESVSQHLERARVELSWGESLRRAGRTADGVLHLEHALARFEALAAVGWAERTRRELELATGSVHPALPRRTDALTTQELRIARHAAGGMRDREIAAALYLSPRTVHSHLQHAYRKLDVANRTQLAGMLAADGIRPLTSAAESAPQPR